MGQYSRSLKISRDLSEASVMQAKLMGHPSWAAYVKSLIRKDIADELYETEVSKILTLRQQDHLDSKLLRKVMREIQLWPSE